jgi:uncharacterized protein YutE (UPF0331/DUF86 family)
VTDDAVPAKLAIIRENLEMLERIPQASWQEFDADFRNLDSALIDIACYLVAVRGRGGPRPSREALDTLEAAALLPPGAAQRFAPIVGFRNRIVHLYDRIDPQIVYAILTRNRGDLVDLARLLASTLGH